jgi:hypothetical protein
MKHPEESLAKELYEGFSQRLGPGQASIAIDGLGVHWHCIVAQKDRACRINCFARPPDNTAQYYSTYKLGEERVATARIASLDDTIAAAVDWLDGRALLLLYEKHTFVDFEKRRLQAVQEEVFHAAPDLRRSLEVELSQRMADIYYLHFRARNRSSELSFYGEKAWPDARFYWDGCLLFEFEAQDCTSLAQVLQDWLYHCAPPSQMRNHFPWLMIGELADYYEAGNPVEGEFLRSWRQMERFYDDSRFPTLATNVKALLAAMRAKGYDKTFRAGQSMWTLILSRSRRHGLKREQSRIQFNFLKEGMDVYCLLESEDPQKITCPRVEYTPEIEGMLERLRKIPIR